MSFRILTRYRHATCIVLAGGLLLLWMAVPLGNAQADEIRLKTGISMHGKIVHEDEKHVVVEMPDMGEISLPRERIEFIKQDTRDAPLNIPLPKRVIDILPWERLSGRLSGIRDRLKEVYTELGSFVQSRAKKSVAPPKNLNGTSFLVDEEVSDSAEAPERPPIANIGFIVGACLLLYGYVSFCLQRLAMLHRISHGWTAWVPILQGILWLRIGGRSVLWLLIPIGLSFVDPRAAELGWFVLGLVSMLSVVHQFQRSGWLALLLCVPGLNLIALGYLAFPQEH